MPARQKIMNHYLSLSDRATGPQSSGLRDVTHLIWPESAFPFFLTREADAMKQIADLLPAGTVLITGAARYADSSPGEKRRAYNSVYVIDHDGTVLSVYDKVHLVPFGEYLPFQTALEKLGLMQLTKVQGGFLSGDRHRSYELRGAPRFLPLICYEIVFPGAVVPPGERPGWLLNVTNDAGSASVRGPISIFSRRACARSRKACRWFARPITVFPRSSTRSAGSFGNYHSAPKACWTRLYHVRLQPQFTHVSGTRSPQRCSPLFCVIVLRYRSRRPR